MRINDVRETGIEAPPSVKRVNWRRLLAPAKKLIPFAAGIAATLLGLFLYNAINPPAAPLTSQQVSTVVAQAMASATPAPAYSSQAYDTIRPSLVLIEVEGVDRNGEAGQGLGSGVVVSDTGQILTALHVVEGATAIKVTFADGTQSGAQVADSQPENDIAVLQPDALPELLVPAVLGNPNALDVGDEAFAFGNPFGLYGSLSAGVVSGFDRSFHAQDSDKVIQGLIQIDTAVNPGNSGGPLLNRYGQVVGIVVGILNPTEQEVFVGIGFAVPITIATTGGGLGPQY